jgi:hypothetical protein
MNSDAIVWQIYSLRLSAGRGPPRRAELRAPANFHEYYLRGTRHRPRPDDPDPYSRFTLLVDALRHFRPETRLERDRDGDWHVTPTARASAYQVCVRDRIDEAVDRIHGRSASERQESEREGRAIWVSRADPPFGAASHLLAILSLLPGTGESRGSQQAADRNADEQPTAAFDSQRAWLLAQIAANGETFSLQFDMLAQPNAAVATTCRSQGVEQLAGRIEDRCTISGVLHRGDGWPITLRASRTARTAAGEEYSSETILSRLAPLEDFVAPSNPCAQSETARTR